jgi:uncharacterized membrane protein YraQ (UPF0718 family)
VVALSTFAAFRGQHGAIMMAMRLTLGFLIPVAVGLIAWRIPTSALLQPKILATLPDSHLPNAGGHAAQRLQPGLWAKLRTALHSTTSDFLDVALFLIIGAAISSVFNTAVNQQLIQPLASNPALATVSMMLLAIGLALCSTSDAFVAASFITFPFTAKLGFLVFGAMFDVKLFFLYSLVFRRRYVVGLGVGLFVVVAFVCVRLVPLHL